MASWLFKEEPTHYSYDELEKDGVTTWSGVRNPVAQKHLKAVRKGDAIFYYHTGKEKAIVAVARAAGNAYPDPKDPDRKSWVVDIVPVERLERPVLLSDLKADPVFAGFDLVRLPRLSVMPVTESLWKKIERLGRSKTSHNSPI
jgi:predicted RNA-binding protein with PUA-like domain